MTSKRRKFLRPAGERHYRKLFLLAVEGRKTEPQYFSLFSDRQAVIQIKCLKSNDNSSPEYVLKRMTTYLSRAEIRDSDEAWLVVDKDQWTDAQLGLLHTWAQKRVNYGLALSNPSFEYWLLLHFEDGSNVTTRRDCYDRLQRHLPGYNKNLDTSKVTPDRIADAIRRARQRDNPPSTDWPRKFGNTTVYRLVSNILNQIRL